VFVEGVMLRPITSIWIMGMISMDKSIQTKSCGRQEHTSFHVALTFGHVHAMKNKIQNGHFRRGKDQAMHMENDHHTS
jgi:hypothetical protein